MRDLLDFVGALTLGCAFAVFLILLHARWQDRTERAADARRAEEQEATDHIRRFSAVMAVLDMDAYRARKANASSASHVASEALPGRLESQPGDESLTTSGAGSNG